MSEFEFVIVLMSFITAFGASELLAGWGRLYLGRAETKIFPLQLAASGLLFVALIQSLWGYWGYRDVSWGFGNFMVALLPLLPLVGAAGIVLPQAGRLSIHASPKEHYESVYKAIFILLALWVGLGTVTEWVLVDTSFHVGQVIRVLGVLMLVGMTFTSKLTIHWVGLVLLAILQLLFVSIVTPILD
jgi:energy-converting hydrogenase Eha subunit H